MPILPSIATTPPKNLEKDEIKDKTKDLTKRLGELQYLMYAEEKHSLLVVLQGMDASGKDGATRKVFRRVNPAGCSVTSFKKPTDLEMSHDFLWRVHQEAPEKGMIKIFNRSHYEDVLIQRVHKWVDMETVHRRYQHINNFEELLKENGTHILKFYLHTSKEAQLISLNERMTNPEKHWKHNANDFKEREHWDEYMAAYEDCFTHCSPDIPWHIIPSDENWYKEYLIAKKVVETLESLDMKWPPLEE